MFEKKKYGKLHWFVEDKEKYKEFKNIQEAQAWGMEHYAQWAKQYKNIMEMADNAVKNSLFTNPLECYCGYSYKQINRFLRNGIDNEYNIYRELADVLSLVLCSAPRIPYNLVLYRLVNDEFIKKLIIKNKRSTPIQEKGFMSTSLLKNITNENEPYASEKNLLKIFVCKGTIGAYVNVITVRNEEEMLLFPNMYLGLSSYPYKDNKSGKTIFECKLI